MINTIPVDKVAQDRFWTVVRTCLIDFHGLSATDAELRSAELRHKIESPPTGLSSDIFYHAEPFDVACDLSDHQLDLARYSSRYKRILAQNK
jgi:hypothetical protein